MPDLQSELSKVLTQAKFDDDEGGVPETTLLDNTLSTSERFWNWIKANPGTSIVEAEAALDVNNLSAYVKNIMRRGLITRTKTPGQRYQYYVSADKYTAMSPQEAIVLAHEARAASAAAKRAKAKRKPRKDKGVPRPHLHKAMTNGDVVIQRAAAKINDRAFNADEILSGLNVLQARELMDKLKKLFGV